MIGCMDVMLAAKVPVAECAMVTGCRYVIGQWLPVVLHCFELLMMLLGACNRVIHAAFSSEQQQNVFVIQAVPQRTAVFEGA